MATTITTRTSHCERGEEHGARGVRHLGQATSLRSRERLHLYPHAVCQHLLDIGLLTTFCGESGPVTVSVSAAEWRDLAAYLAPV